MLINSIILILELIVALFGQAECEDAPSVKTQVGEIIGKVETLDVFGEQRKVNRYFGIPYAEAPIGELRFKKPVPKHSLDSPFDATKYGKVCLQMNLFPFPEDMDVSHGEDCLTLNVYVPVANENGGNDGNIPVMLFIHGGGFMCDSALPYVSDVLSAHGNVIVVTFNYRLSIWGFLSTDDDNARGNYGLWDQHLAIKWVHDNIESFGGDPQRITIFGESAGGTSVIYQSLYEGNKGLFHRAIAQSGSITPYWAISKRSKEDALRFGKLMGCETIDTGQLVDCIRNKAPESVDATLNDPNNEILGLQTPFAPTIDGELVKEHPKDILLGDSNVLAKGREFFSQLDLLMGINAEEGLMMLDPSVGIEDPETFEPNRTHFEEELLPFILPYELGVFPDIVKQLIAHEYTDWDDPDSIELRRNKLVALYTDLFFGVPLTETVNRHRTLVTKHSSTKNTYMYLFDILPSARGLPAPSWATGANHGDDLTYLFYDESGGIMKFMPWVENFKPTDWDRENAKYLITMWSNFAKSG